MAGWRRPSLRRYLWLILFEALLTAVAAFGFSAMQLPVYEARAVLFITSHSSQISPRDLDPVRQRYATYLLSSLRAEAVVAELQLDMDPVQLLEMATIEAGANAPTVEVAVENTDPALATAIARVWAEQLIDVRRRENAELLAEQQIDAELLDRITVELDSPRPGHNALAGLLLGAAGGIALAFWLEWQAAARLRDRADVKKALGLPVLGQIPPAGKG